MENDPVVDPVEPVNQPANEPANKPDGQSQIREFADDDLVRAPGLDKPIKYGELYKRLQSDHTRKTQEAARIQKDFERKQAEWDQSRRQQETHLKQLATELLARQRNGGAGAPVDPYARLEGVQFLDGKTAAELFRNLQENGFGGVNAALRERDQVIQAMYQQMQRMGQQMQTLSGSHANQGFESKISSVLKDLGYSDKYRDFAKEVYLAYEHDDNFDVEYPDILKGRIEGLRAAWQEEQEQRVQQSRRQTFPFPGKGGQGAAGKGIGLKGHEKASEVADTLWEAMQSGNKSDT